MKIKKYYECTSVSEFADNSSLFQVLGLYSVHNTNVSLEEQLQIPHEYRNRYMNKELYLLDDVDLFKEMDKKQWEKEKEFKVSDTNGTLNHMSSYEMDTRLDNIATVAH